LIAGSIPVCSSTAGAGSWIAGMTVGAWVSGVVPQAASSIATIRMDNSILYLVNMNHLHCDISIDWSEYLQLPE
jgi:hypothetical protein